MAEGNTQGIPGGLPGGCFICSAADGGELLYADGNVIQLYGCRTMEELRALSGSSLRGMVHEDDLPGSVLAMYGGGQPARYRIRTRDGGVRHVEATGRLLHDGAGRGFVYVLVADAAQAPAGDGGGNAAEYGGRDQLTGLYDMPSFFRAAQDVIESPGGRARGIAFIHFDIANFKLFNERYGFQKGDELLCRVAGIIRESFEERLAARLSNDHFAVCTFAEDAEGRVEVIHDRVLSVEDGARVEVKAGIYRLQDSVAEAGLACDRARLACNNIKGRYDISYCVYDAALSKRLRQQQYVVEHIEDAVENEYIKVYYQPVVRVKTEEICGYEALARWQDPQYGMLSPADFIETLEQFHLIHKLDGFVVRKVCEDYQALKERGEPLVPVSVNLSRMDFQLCNVFDMVDSYRRQYRVPKEMLDIEVTESALNDNSDFMKNEVLRFHDQGYQVWIDDFGSGYSSLNVLTEYTFDVLKLDMKFLRSYDSNPKTGPLLYYIAFVAQEMGIQTLSEGVETLAHFDFLKKIGCEKAQGYLFGRPLPLEETRAATRAAGLRWERP